MLFHEDFLRCPKCNGAWFRKNVFIQLNKEAFALKDETIKIKEDSKTTEYICRDCGNLIYVDKTKIN